MQDGKRRKRYIALLLLSSLIVALAFSSLSCSYFYRMVETAEKPAKEPIEVSESYKEKLTKLLEGPPFIYVAANNGSGAVVVIDSQSDDKTDSFPTSKKIIQLALRPGGNLVYATGSNKIFVINTENGEVVSTIETKDTPTDIAFHPDGTKFYVTHGESNYVSVFDAENNKVITTIEVGDYPASIAITFDGSRAYVGHSDKFEGMETKEISGVPSPIEMPTFSKGSTDIAVIDLKDNKVIANIPTKGNATVAVRPDGKIVYATTCDRGLSEEGVPGGEGYSSALDVIDTSSNTIVKEIDMTKYINPQSLAFTPDGKKAYVVCGAEDHAIALDAENHEIKTTIALDLGG